MIEVIRVDTGRVSLLPVLKGLVSQADVVRDILGRGEFSAVALSISPEELQTLEENPGLQVPPANLEEEVYMRGLKRFGPVAKPPPCFVESIELAKALGIPRYALDLDDETYTEVYCREVKGLEMVRYSMSLKKLPRHPFPAETPEDFVKTFDSVVNRLGGHRRVERAREGHMARTIIELSRTESQILAVVERERFPGVQANLMIRD